QLGLGNNRNKLIFEEIKGIPKDIVQISCGSHYTIIRRVNGILMGCGSNYTGQLGLGNTGNKLIFEEIKGIPKDIVEIVCSSNHTIIRVSNGVLMACGFNYYGQLGLGNTGNKLIFEEIKGIPKDIVEISCGYYHTIIKRANGILM